MEMSPRDIKISEFDLQSFWSWNWTFLWGCRYFSHQSTFVWLDQPTSVQTHLEIYFQVCQTALPCQSWRIWRSLKLPTIVHCFIGMTRSIKNTNNSSVINGINVCVSVMICVDSSQFLDRKALLLSPCSLWTQMWLEELLKIYITYRDMQHDTI